MCRELMIRILWGRTLNKMIRALWTHGINLLPLALDTLARAQVPGLLPAPDGG
jgi:hypothetical protein